MLDFIAWTIIGLLALAAFTTVSIEYEKRPITVIAIAVSMILVLWAIFRLFIN